MTDQLKSIAERIGRLMDERDGLGADKRRGHIYAAYSSNREWLKIGFSSAVSERLSAINRDFGRYAPFVPIGIVPSTQVAERQIHRILRPFRMMKIDSCREIYPTIPVIEDFVARILAGAEWRALDAIEAIDLRMQSRALTRQPDIRFSVLGAYLKMQQRWGFA